MNNLNKYRDKNQDHHQREKVQKNTKNPNKDSKIKSTNN